MRRVAVVTLASLFVGCGSCSRDGLSEREYGYIIFWEVASAELVWGTVDLTEAEVQNLTGISDTTTAADLLASAGIPALILERGGRIAGVRLDHVWVVAHLDVIPTTDIQRAYPELS